MRRCLAILLFGLFASAPVAAQTIRGTIVDDTRRLPIRDVLVTLVGSEGTDVGPGARSDSLGGFVLYASRAASYRVKATRIGFRQLTSDAFQLGTGQLVVMQLRMTTVAQELVPIQIVERRALSLNELDSWMGFNLRKEKPVGKFMDAKDLAVYKLEGAGEVLRAYWRPFIRVVDGPAGPIIAAANGMGKTTVPCKVFLDGRELIHNGDRDASAYAMLEAVPANELYGVEAHHGMEIPPASVGGSLSPLGVAGRDSCVVAVWTNNGRLIALSRAPQGAGLSGIQVIRGTTVDFETGRPVGGVRIRVYELTDQTIADVRSDTLGEFTVRTRRMGALRIAASDFGRGTLKSGPFKVVAEELVLVKVYVSATKPVEAPLAIAARVHPQDNAVNAVGSFVYRRERAIEGSFFSDVDIRARGARTLAELIGGVEGIRVDGTPPTDSLVMRGSSGDPCRPTVFVNGMRLVGVANDPVKTIRPDSLYGVEVYGKPSIVPSAHADAVGECGMIGVWTKRASS